MLKTIFLAAAALAALPAVASAYGACHAGYTHVGPNGAYHTSETVARGPNGAYAGGHTTATGSGGAYHTGTTGAAYGGVYHYSPSYSGTGQLYAPTNSSAGSAYNASHFGYVR